MTEAAKSGVSLLMVAATMVIAVDKNLMVNEKTVASAATIAAMAVIYQFFWGK